MKTIIYLAQVSACTGIFYLFYHLVLRKLTFFTINRWYLLGTLLLSFIIPLITIPANSIPENHFFEQVSFSAIERAYILTPSEPVKDLYSAPADISLDKTELLAVFYFLVAGILSIYLIVSIFSIYKNLKGKIVATIGNVKVFKGSSYFRNSSFLNYVFLDDRGLSETELEQIIEHEMVHIEQMHSLDKIIARLSQIILWFNPFVYSYCKAIDANHEYEVDNIILKNSDKQVYANLILRLAASGSDLLGHQFSKFPLSNRISMLFSKPSKNMKKVIYALILPLIAIGCLVFANRELKGKPVQKIIKPLVSTTIKPDPILKSEPDKRQITGKKQSIAAVTGIDNDRNAEVISNRNDDRKSNIIDTNSAPVKQSQDMQKYLTDTRLMAREGKYKEALDRYIWFYQHAPEYAPAMSGIRNSFMIYDWKSLAGIYPPAMTALRETRDQKTKELISRTENLSNLFRDVIALNRVLGDDPKTIELFQTLARSAPDDARKLWIYVDRLMFASKRYDIIRNYGRDPLSEFAVVKANYDRLTKASNETRAAASAANLKRLTENNFTEQSLQLIQYALFVEDIRSAKEIQQKAMAVAEDYRLRDAVVSQK